MATVQGNGANLSFQYNADGLRVSKTAGTTTTNFSYASGLLVSQTDGTNTLHFTYDPDGVALGVNYNGTDYYYLYNAQGDVIGLYNGSGALVVNYSYDSWGKLLSTTGSLASTLGVANPLRYRGYYYDTETNLYLLESRYYDPEIGRFINTDGELDNRTVNSTNLYVYCGNDPINFNDDGGNRWGAIIAGGIIGGAAAALKAWANKEPRKAIIKKAIIGAAVGAATSAIGGWLGTIATARKAYKTYKLVRTITTAARAAVNYYAPKAETYLYNKWTPRKSNTTKGSQRKSNKTSVARLNLVSAKENIKSYVANNASSITNSVVSTALGVGTDSVLGDVSFLAEFSTNFMVDTNTSAFQAIAEHSSVALFPEAKS